VLDFAAASTFDRRLEKTIRRELHLNRSALVGARAVAAILLIREPASG
jgi:hypothetical protein